MNPELITWDQPFFEVDSNTYPNGIIVTELSCLTSVDGTYELITSYYSSADPPVLVDYIDTLNVGASDRRASSTTFENSFIDAGETIYFDFPTNDIDFIHMVLSFYVRGPK